MWTLSRSPRIPSGHLMFMHGHVLRRIKLLNGADHIVIIGLSLPPCLYEGIFYQVWKHLAFQTLQNLEMFFYKLFCSPLRMQTPSHLLHQRKLFIPYVFGFFYIYIYGMKKVIFKVSSKNVIPTGVAKPQQHWKIKTKTKADEIHSNIYMHEF